MAIKYLRPEEFSKRPNS